MKHQYYADSRDVAKWSTLIRLAREQSVQKIVQIAMLTPDGASSHGLKRDDPRDADPIVAKFFAEERLLIRQSPAQKQIDRITRLGKRFTPPLVIEVISDPYQNRNRRQYFENVCSRLSDIGQPVIAFADPDTGIAGGKPSSNHITIQGLNAIWCALQGSSLLVVFQHEQHATNWAEASRERLASALEIAVDEVGQSTYPRVTFLFARKR